ncbi:pectate lyase [Spirochaetia bacterium]|nr:pectate lyase [Spirochaetia bacterium]
MKKSLVGICITLALLFAGCDDDSADKPPDPNKDGGAFVTQVTLDKTGKILTVNSTLTLSATVIPSGAAQGVTWSVDDPGKDAVTIVDNGDGTVAVTAKAEGQAIITAVSVGGKADESKAAASCTVTVSAPESGLPAAFPGAEGHGRYVSGGRGGQVYYVTTLTDNNSPGSLRYGIGLSGPRTILFKVAGTIALNSKLTISKGDLTIAGQSAPGDGICLAGHPVVVNADNVIIRYIRCRMGDPADESGADGDDAMGGRFRNNIIIDHCSISWSTDECASFYANSNFTMQWCLISESLNNSAHSKGAHGYGGIWGGQPASFHHNLMAHHKSRMPRLGPGATSTPDNENVDIRNNVYYNYNGEGCYGAEAMHVNIVNNYYRPGPAAVTNEGKRGRILAIDKQIPDEGYFPVLWDIWGTFYINGNIVDGHANATADNWTYGVYNQIHSKYGTLTQTVKDALKLSSPLPSGVVTTHTAEQALDLVLRYAGCSLHRDSVDQRIANEAGTGTTTYMGPATNLPGIIDSTVDLKPAGAGAGWSPLPVLSPGTPVTDSDSDGIPNGWLDANYPGKTAGDLNAQGYTYLEVYLNSLVADITAAQNG